MELYFKIAIIIIGASFTFMAVFINVFIEQLKNENENKNEGYIQDMIVYRP